MNGLNPMHGVQTFLGLYLREVTLKRIVSALSHPQTSVGNGCGFTLPPERGRRENTVLELRFT